MTLEELREASRAMGLYMPLSENMDALRAPLPLGPFTLQNRLAIQPMEGCDGTPEGKPGELTVRRYERFARGGAGLLWFEATAIVPEGRAGPRQLLLNEQNLSSLQRLVNRIRELSLRENGFAPLLILQATHSGRYAKPESLPASRLSDDYLQALEERFGAATRLAAAAGFDGIDVKSCHGYLLSELLSQKKPEVLVNGVKAAQAAAPPGFLVTSRTNVYDGDAYPGGFGAGEDMEEPLRLIGILHKELSMPLVNITMGCPYVNPHVNRPFSAGPYAPPEPPLAGVARMVRLAGQVQRAYPSLAVLASGLSYLRQSGANLAAGAVEQGDCKLAGFGRQAFAYPDFARDILRAGGLDPGKCCAACGKCSQLMRAGSTAGCVVRDGGTYLPIYERDVKA